MASLKILFWLHRRMMDLDNQKKPTLLVGCGINYAFNKKFGPGISNFSYHELLPCMFDCDIKNPVKLKLDEYLNSGCRNFEEFLRNGAGGTGSLSGDDIKCAKQEFVRILGDKHLNFATRLNVLGSFTPGCYETFKNNIKTFERIYTINFDLKLYFLMKELDLFGNSQNRYNGFNDSFYPPPAITGSNCKVYPFKVPSPTTMVPWSLIYLHGAMHLFGYSESKSKHGYKIANVTSGNLISNRVSITGLTGFHDLFVLGGTTDEKRQIIDNNTYLTQAFNSLSTIEGELVIYGCSMDENDAHIWRAINENDKITKIYIGQYQNGDGGRVAERAKRFFDQKELSFFKQDQLNIWDCDGWLDEITKDDDV